MIMKKAEKLLFFKMFNFFLIFCSFPSHSDSHNDPILENNGNNPTFERELSGSQEVRNLTAEQKRLRIELVSAGVIVDKTQYHGVRRIYMLNDRSKSVEVFKEECPDEYNSFKNDVNTFMSNLNGVSDPDCEHVPADGFFCTNSYDKDTPANIKNSIKVCMQVIRDKRQELIKSFTIPILKNYVNYRTLNENMVLYLKQSPFLKGIISLEGQSKNFNEIKNKIRKYMEFEEQCLIQAIAHKIDCFYGDAPRHICSDESNIKSFKNFSKIWSSQNCRNKFDEFKKFAESQLFKDFIALAEKDCKNEDSLKKSSNSVCKSTVNKLKPEYPDKDNKDNVFQQCQTEIDNAYKKCFGEPSQRTDLQELLYLIDQKSPAVCDNNRISQARSALQNCVNAVNKCSQACQNQITAFKEDFLQCFFLPDFKEADKEPSSMIVHKHTSCKVRIKELKDSFVKQSQAEPFKIKKPSFGSLDSQGSQSLGHQIAKACEKPLDERQLEKKQAEMQQVCRQNPNSQQALINPVTAVQPSSHNSNNDRDTSSSSRTQSQPFSYGQNKNKGFQFENNLPQNEKQNQEGSPFSYNMPTDNPRAKIPKDNKDTNSVSAEFDSSLKDSSDSLSPAGLSDLSSSSSQRKTASQRSLSEDVNSFEEDLQKEKSQQSIMDKAGSVIKRYLSSDEQYGVIDGNPRSQSATQSFFNWMNDKKRKVKKTVLNAYDRIGGIDQAEFKRRLHLNSEDVNLFELQGELLKKACEIHNCDGSGASPEIQSQIQQQRNQIQQQRTQSQQQKTQSQQQGRKPSAQ